MNFKRKQYDNRISTKLYINIYIIGTKIDEWCMVIMINLNDDIMFHRPIKYCYIVIFNQ